MDKGGGSGVHQLQVRAWQHWGEEASWQWGDLWDGLGCVFGSLGLVLVGNRKKIRKAAVTVWGRWRPKVPFGFLGCEQRQSLGSWPG